MNTVGKSRWRVLLPLMALVAAVAMLFVFAGVSSADAGGNDAAGNICVDGYVIDHRETPVDGTRTTPPLMVEAHNGMVQSVEVGGDGYFKFDKLTEGEWNFMLPLPWDWDGLVPKADRSTQLTPTVAETGATKLAEKDGCYRIVFKIRRLFDITVIKWEELLDSAVQRGVGWEITFDPQGDPFVKSQTKTTNGNGEAVFTVTPGSWYVKETVKTGWVPVTPPKVHLMLDTYAPPGAQTPVIFKNRQPPCDSSIIVEKHGYGTRWDEQMNPVEEWLGPLAGWKVTVRRVGSHVSMTKVTDATGKAVFDGLYPGVYIVEEYVQRGWEAMTDNPQIVVVRVGDHGQCEDTRVRFENKEVAGKLNIHGKKVYKAWTGPADGAGLSGWVITATLQGTNYMTTTVTNALGDYMFTEEQLKKAGIGFPGATVEVCEESRDNWIHVTPRCRTVMFPYPLPPDYPGATVNFTNVQDPPLPGTATTMDCQLSHRVALGENLSSIALRYGASVSAIAQASGITNVNYIRAGDTLCIR